MREFLDYASEKYYEGRPIMSDAEFDVLWAEYGSANVGHKVTDGLAHWKPMYSLQKVFSMEDAPFELSGVAASPKLDGAAVSLLYVNGNLSLALARGDGKIGRDITDKLRHKVPNVLQQTGILQITGEIVSPSTIANARNYASGALNLKSVEEFLERDTTFVAYDCQPSLTPKWTTALALLEKEGFQTVISFDASNYPTDGIVFRVDDYKTFNKMGFTSHHPRGAFALKEQKKGEITTLLDVVWQVGKSGVVSPVAILAPIMIGDAVVSKATLHNIEYIEGLGLEIGCQVEVIRSGEIIPRILRRVNA